MGRWCHHNSYTERTEEAVSIYWRSASTNTCLNACHGSTAWEFVQVLHTYGCQWITVSTVGCPPASIKVYDSAHGKLSSSTKKVIADLMMTEVTAISVYYVDVQRQSGENDCALFALAFVWILLACSHYDQIKMRNHLQTCLVAGKVTPFPQMDISTQRQQCKKARVDFIPVFCVCRLPEGPQWSSVHSVMSGITRRVWLWLMSSLKIDNYPGIVLSANSRLIMYNTVLTVTDYSYTSLLSLLYFIHNVASHFLIQPFLLVLIYTRITISIYIIIIIICNI